MSHKSEDYKLTAIKHYLVEDKTQDEVCQIFQCSRRSLMRWVEQYKRRGNIERQNRIPIAYKVKREHIRFIKDELRKNKTVTMEDLLYLIKRKYPSMTLRTARCAREFEPLSSQTFRKKCPFFTTQLPQWHYSSRWIIFTNKELLSMFLKSTFLSLPNRAPFCVKYSTMS